MKSVQIDIREVDPQSTDPLLLLERAAVEAKLLYPEQHDPFAPRPTNSPTPPRGLYLVAYRSGIPVGMGAHRPIDEQTTEVRRMFVITEERRSGVGAALLAKIEGHARLLGFTALVLETGNRQIPAMALYERSGFRRIEPFGVYTDDPTSVCYRKEIHAKPFGAA